MLNAEIEGLSRVQRLVLIDGVVYIKRCVMLSYNNNTKPNYKLAEILSTYCRFQKEKYVFISTAESANIGPMAICTRIIKQTYENIKQNKTYTIKFYWVWFYKGFFHT